MQTAQQADARRGGANVWSELAAKSSGRHKNKMPLLDPTPPFSLPISPSLSPSDVVKREARRDSFLEQRLRNAEVSEARLLEVEGVAQVLGSGLRVERLDVAAQLGVDRLHANEALGTVAG